MLLNEKVTFLHFLIYGLGCRLLDDDPDSDDGDGTAEEKDSELRDSVELILLHYNSTSEDVEHDLGALEDGNGVDLVVQLHG